MSTVAMAAKLHGVDTNQAIHAIKALRYISGGGLRWAKMDVYDKVRDGHVISVPIRQATDINELVAAGWTASLDEDASVSFSAQISAAKFEDLCAIVRALGGEVG